MVVWLRLEFRVCGAVVVRSFDDTSAYRRFWVGGGATSVMGDQRTGLEVVVALLDGARGKTSGGKNAVRGRTLRKKKKGAPKERHRRRRGGRHAVRVPGHALNRALT
jgi:hypothetical protein